MAKNMSRSSVREHIFKIVFGYDFHKAPEDCDLIICNYLDTAKNINDVQKKERKGQVSGGIESVLKHATFC